MDTDQVNFRMPTGMRDALKALARRNRRSVTSEVIFHLERVLANATAATGEGFSDTAPAAAPDKTALTSGPIYQRS